MWTTAIILIAATQVYAADKCERVKINQQYYKRQLVSILDGYPTNLVVDSNTEHIFFILHKRNYTKGIYVLKHGALGAKEVHISDDLLAQCIELDDKNDKLYIGTNQGLVSYDYMAETMAVRPLGDDDIRTIFIDKFANQMYITVGAMHEVYHFVNGSAAVRRYEQMPKAYNFVLDRRGNLFYEYIDGKLYFFAMEYYEPIQYKGFSKELKFLLRLNNNDEAIIAVKGALYKLTTKSILPTKIGEMGFKITGMAFDEKNNIIIGTKGKIYRFKPLGPGDTCPSEDFYIANL